VTELPDSAGIELEIIERIAEISAADWDSLACVDDPFLEHALLAALEASGSVGSGTSWQPRIEFIFERGGADSSRPSPSLLSPDDGRRARAEPSAKR
jgi:predicted N-acyltransferase